MRPRVDLRIPSYNEARPLVSYADRHAGKSARAAAKPPRAKARRRSGWPWPAIAAMALSGWVVATVPFVRNAAVIALTPVLNAAGVALIAPSVEIADVHARRTEIDGQTLLYVEGQLVNKAKTAQKPPMLLITIVGTDGQPLYAWKSRLAAKTIAAAAGAPFQTRLLSPPEKFQSLSVSLVDEG